MNVINLCNYFVGVDILSGNEYLTIDNHRNDAMPCMQSAGGFLMSLQWVDKAPIRK